MWQFQDLSIFVIPEWIADSFTVDSSSVSIDLHLQESLIDLQTGEEMK